MEGRHDLATRLGPEAIGEQPVTGIVVTHDMKTALKVADRVVMLYPLARLEEDEPQILFDGAPVCKRYSSPA